MAIHRFEDEDGDDVFDRLPEPLLRLIFISVADIKTLIRCRAVSKRFNSLVPQVESLVLKVERVVSSDTDSFLAGFFKSVIKSIQHLVSSKHSHPRSVLAQNSPAQILSGFEKVKELEIELPAGDLRLEKGALIRWNAVFGKTLKSCVIVGVQSVKHRSVEAESDVAGSLKMRVVWTISALIAASTRHYATQEIVKEHKEMKMMEVRDKAGEGRMVMDDKGLREWSEEHDLVGNQGGGEKDKSRTTVPAVQMRMWHHQKVELKNGITVKGAMVVVVRPADVALDDGLACNCCDKAIKEDEGLAKAAFSGMYGEIVQCLFEKRSYMLEMNSF